jgi:uncharacterized protein with NRDE domain
MCLIAFAWNAHPDYRLIVGANRDEWHERPASPAAWWRDHPQILAGRDLKAGGTWMGITRGGRFAAVTNFRDPGDKKSTARSRGELVTAFLLGRDSPEAFLGAVNSHAHDYNGFNLIVGDTASLAYFSSRNGTIENLTPGVYALSNHTLNEPWPKVTAARSALEAIVQAEMPEQARQMAIYELLSDARAASDNTLPDTGVGIEWERVLSPALIVTPDYGTRASAVLSITNTNVASFEERTRAVDGTVTRIATFKFELRPH